VTTTTQDGKAITAGFPWSIRVTMSEIAFPSGAVLVGHVRRRVDDTAILAELSTANGRIARVDDYSVDVSIPGSVSDEWAPGTVTFDIARTDLDPDQYLGFRITVPVLLPVTRLPT
jgi:hypothetical protein